jgi:threonine aldolase
MQSIDLRSDTVTKPSAGMREAMMNAPVGDDVYGEDPSVTELERYAANLFGTGSAVYCPSGTMTNQIAIKVHTRPGDEVICDVNSHIFNYESGGIAFNSGVQARLVQGDEGRLDPDLIEPHINGPQDWLARTSLVSLENTVNRAGGSYYKLDQMKTVSEFCRTKNLKIHLDGARIFNALAVTGDSPGEIGKLFDSVSICLSKGLGAPVGSLLLGNKQVIAEARRIRKVLGGGMRQAGIIAAAGLYALKNNVDRLGEDHRRAKVLGDCLSQLPFVQKVLPVYTNIVIFVLDPKMPGDQFERKLAGKGIRVAPFGKQTVRMVTHLDFTEDMKDRVVEVLRALD